MRCLFGLLVALSTFSATGSAQDAKRFVERTPMPHHPATHTMETTGFPGTISPLAVSSITRFDAGGYIGGSRPVFSGLPLHNPVAATGPLNTGTYGTDFGGFKGNTGRVFLTPAGDSSHAGSIAHQYRTDGPVVPNPLAWRPLRKAIIEAREGHGEKAMGHE